MTVNVTHKSLRLKGSGISIVPLTSSQKKKVPYSWLILILLGLSLISLWWGPAGSIIDSQIDLQSILFSLRLPRTLTALLVGTALGTAGWVLQNITNNRLADPGLLGINAGAALGVVTGIVLAAIESNSAYLLWSLIGAVLGNICVLLFSLRNPSSILGSKLNTSAPLRLVLAGTAVSASFQGLCAALLLSQPSAYEQYRFWELGSLAGMQLSMLAWTAPLIVLGLLLSFLLVRPLSALQLGDELASSLGHHLILIRFIAIMAITLLCGSAVALCGPIAFIGLLAPWLARRLVARESVSQLLATAFTGAIILIAADLAARYVNSPFETPLSALTALLGTPLLIWQAKYHSYGKVVA